MSQSLEVTRIVHPIFSSNTYILSFSACSAVWLIDVGDFGGVLKLLHPSKEVRGVFITHAHYDHILGINDLIGQFPRCDIFISEYGCAGLKSEKLNLSFYHDQPVNYQGNNITIIKEGTTVNLFNGIDLDVMETPGHNLGSLTFKVENFLFTGDSFIPGYEVVTKLKSGNKQSSIASLKKIMACINNKTILCPGHGMMGNASDLINT